MLDQQLAEKIADSYLRCLSDADVEGVLALYADDARVEDPVGSEPLIGKTAIATFYRGAVASAIKLERTGAVRYAANELVFPFVCNTGAADAPMRIEIIDHFSLNQAGLISSMRAFWSESNIHLNN